MIIAFLTVGTMGLSNTSLGYLNYPTQVIFKCCKLIPVMIGGVFIQGKGQCWTLFFLGGGLSLSETRRQGFKGHLGSYSLSLCMRASGCGGMGA